MADSVDFENLKTIAQVAIAMKYLKTKFEEHIKILEDRIIVLEREKEDRAEVPTSYSSSITGNNWSTSSSRSKPPIEQLLVVNAAINEQKDREKRKKNIIVYGLPVSKKETLNDQLEEDKIEIHKLFSEINVEVIPVFQRRLKTKAVGKPGPVLVVLNEISERNPILSKAKLLRDKANYKNVFISPDLTAAERMEDYELRQKRDKMNNERMSGAPFRYAIRGSSIVKFKIQLN